MPIHYITYKHPTSLLTQVHGPYIIHMNIETIINTKRVSSDIVFPETQIISNFLSRVTGNQPAHIRLIVATWTNNRHNDALSRVTTITTRETQQLTRVGVQPVAEGALPRGEARQFPRHFHASARRQPSHIVSRRRTSNWPAAHMDARLISTSRGGKRERTWIRSRGGSPSRDERIRASANLTNAPLKFVSVWMARVDVSFLEIEEFECSEICFNVYASVHVLMDWNSGVVGCC